jgi:hypothetical protein
MLSRIAALMSRPIRHRCDRTCRYVLCRHCCDDHSGRRSVILNVDRAGQPHDHVTAFGESVLLAERGPAHRMALVVLVGADHVLLGSDDPLEMCRPTRSLRACRQLKAQRTRQPGLGATAKLCGL